MKRAIRLAMAAVMLLTSVSALAGCKKRTDADLTVWWPDMTAQIETLADSKVFQKIEEITGVKVNYLKESTDEFNRRVRNSDYADIMITTGQDVYPGGLDKAISDGSYIDLTDYVEQYAPNYKGFLQISKQIEREAKTDSGKIGGFFGITDVLQGPWYGYVIRQDWLDILQDTTHPSYNATHAVSFSGSPVTYDDWAEMLKGFKNHPSIKASAPAFLFSGGTDLLDHFNAGYGVGREFYQVDGTVKFGPMEAEFKDYVNRMRSWYNAGYFKTSFNLSSDPIPTVTDTVGIDGKGSVGAFPIVYTSIVTTEEIAAQFGNASYRLTPVAAPVLTAGDQLHIRQSNIHTGMVASVTRACKDVEKAVKWLDFMYSEEGIRLLNYGIEGETYTMVDGEPRFTELIYNNPDKLTLTEAMYKYVAHSFVGNVEWQREVAVLPEKCKSAMDIWSANNDGSYLLTPAATMTSAEASDYATKFGSLQTFVLENVPKYIVGTKSMSVYESDFIAGLTSNRVADLIGYKQAALNRYLAR